MDAMTLGLRSLGYYWRSNLAVVAGFATATAVLAGALAVGDSVRESLARSALRRLGRATHAVESTRFFREELAAEVGERLDGNGAPLIALHGLAADPSSGRRAGDVLVYGVDARFWSLHALPDVDLKGREALLSEALWSELGPEAGASVLLRLESESEVPGSSLFGTRDAPAQSVRITARGVLARAKLGDFALRPARDDVRAAFVPLPVLQRSLDVPGRVNTVLLSVAGGDDARVGATLRESVRLEDLGLRLHVLESAAALQLDSTSALLDDATARAARGVAVAQGFHVSEALTYLANTIRSDTRELPYALVAALDDDALRTLAGRDLSSDGDPLLLNEWAAADLRAAPGQSLELDYYVWREKGELATLRAAFRLAGIVPISGLAADRDLAPEYPGITDAPRLSDWQPPFPIDLRRIRRRDEEYWDRHRTTPKAFVSLSKAQELWGHRLGRLTAMRFSAEPGVDLRVAGARLAEGLRAALTRPEAAIAAGPASIRVENVRSAALRAAQGSTDFGAYFAYFSVFLVAAALLLAALFFRLGIEQRQREVGLLGALGFSAARLRAQFLGEGAALAAVGGLLGAAGSLVYAALVLWGLRLLWSDSLPTSELALHVAPRSPTLGALGAVVAGVLAVVGTLRDVQRLSVRALLSGAPEVWHGAPAPRRFLWPLALGLTAAVVLLAARAERLPQAAGFFVGGSLLLGGAVLASRVFVGGRPRRAAAIPSVAALGRRGASFRPGRSVLCVALLASAIFVIVAVGAFRLKEADDSRSGEAGGYALLAWSLQPLHSDPSSAEGRATLGLSEDELRGVSIVGLRASRGEDASCLNLHRPQQPTVVAPPAAFLREGRFSFQASLAETPAERNNPWLLLEREAEDGALPAIADASSLAYVLHKKLGDVLELGASSVRLRFVGALRPGLLQSEVLVGEGPFLKAFPSENGYRFFLIDAPSARAADVASHLESQLGDFGFDVTETQARLAAFHRVENMYISTFQALGALGLLLGTAGLATVLVRNALEQRRELALLRATGYTRAQLLVMTLAENGLLLLLGFAAGALPALVAIGPVLEAQRSGWPLALIGALGVAVAITGMLVSCFAVVVIHRMPLLSSLRSE